VNFEDKLLDDLTKESIRKIPQVVSQSVDEKIWQHEEFRTPVPYGSGVRKGPCIIRVTPWRRFHCRRSYIYSRFTDVPAASLT
jgi:hypothetical protein